MIGAYRKKHPAAAAPGGLKPPKAAKKAKIGNALRKEIWNKHIGADVAAVKCPCCQRNDIRMNEFSAGHIVAESKGGANDSDNLIPICGSCNSDMSTENMNEFCIRVFKRAPVLPNRLATEA